jgi:hypothetical protein
LSAKQDGAFTRTPSQLEQKYQFGKTFAEMIGLINDTRDKVDSVESVLRSEIREQSTSLTRDTEQIIMSALEEYQKTEDAEKFRQTLEAELKVMADQISLNFEATSEQITTVNGELQAVLEDLQKHFDFTVNGLTIRAGSGEMQLVLDNDVIRFIKNGEEFGWWDGDDFHTGNIYVEVNERARFGDFAFVPRSNGSLSFLKVGG